MTNLSRLDVIRLLAFIMLLVLPAKSGSQHRSRRLLEQVAKTYGLDSFGQIEAIRYTWNGESPGSSKLLTCGSGSPKTNRFPTKEQTKTASR